MKKIGVIILNYKTYQMTISLIKMFKMLNDKDICFEIVVIDNNSNNGSYEKINAYIKNNENIHLFKSKNNAGYASGNNIGLRYCYSQGIKYALVTNNDIEITSIDVIKNMISVIENNPNCAAVSPIIKDKDGKKDPPIYFKKPNFSDLTFNIYKNRKERFEFDENKTCKIYAPRGSFMLVELNSLNQIDYLDENTFLYYEEPILAERLLSIGKECWHCGNAFVIHNHGKTISSVMKKKKTCNILCESLDYYLSTYRKMNIFERKICVFVRFAVFMRR